MAPLSLSFVCVCQEFAIKVPASTEACGVLLLFMLSSNPLQLDQN